MKYTVTFYCPDRHILYDGGRLPDRKGIGGGVNARIRLSQALARRGHKVTLICNCIRDEMHLGIHYIPLDQAKQIETEVLILTTSGDALSLEPVLKLAVSSKLKVLLLHGIPKPKGIDEIVPDYYYPPSNFIRQTMLTEWGGIPPDRIFVSHRGVVKRNFERSRFSSLLFPRNGFRLAYVGHPSKGREPALKVLDILRKIDSRYHLYVFGDEQLWGGQVQGFRSASGVRNFGMVNQRRLAKELLRCNYGLFLQTRLEPFSNAMLETLSAGCIPIASPIGGFTEQIINEWNGLFVDGSPDDPTVWNETARLIHELINNPDRLGVISQNARQSTYDWDVVAQSWEEHWDMVLNQASNIHSGQGHECPNCKQNAVEFSDGFHCLHCGYFSRPLKS